MTTTITPGLLADREPLAVLGARPRFPAGLPLAPPSIPDVPA